VRAGSVTMSWSARSGMSGLVEPAAASTLSSFCSQTRRRGVKEGRRRFGRERRKQGEGGRGEAGRRRAVQQKVRRTNIMIGRAFTVVCIGCTWEEICIPLTFFAAVASHTCSDKPVEWRLRAHPSG